MRSGASALRPDAESCRPPRALDRPPPGHALHRCADRRQSANLRLGTGYLKPECSTTRAARRRWRQPAGTGPNRATALARRPGHGEWPPGPNIPGFAENRDCEGAGQLPATAAPLMAGRAESRSGRRAATTRSCPSVEGAGGGRQLPDRCFPRFFAACVSPISAIRRNRFCRPLAGSPLQTARPATTAAASHCGLSRARVQGRRSPRRRRRCSTSAADVHDPARSGA